MSDAAVHWQVDGDFGVLKCGPLSGRVEPAVTGEQFRLLQWRGANVDCCIVLSVAGDEPYDLRLLQRHHRGDDLIDVLPRSQTQRISPEIYWRARLVAELGAVQLELVYSKQTDLLDSNPATVVVSQVAGARVFCCSDLGSAAFREIDALPYPGLNVSPGSAHQLLAVHRCEPLGFSYAEMVHPTDFVGAQLFSNDGHLRSSVAALFAERLEKGVIRRARVSGWFLPAENDLAVAVQLAREFVAEPLPLTA